MELLAFRVGIYNTLKFVHIAAAIMWVGSGLFVQYYTTRLRRSDELRRLAEFARDLEKAANHLFIPASVTVLLMGILMVAYSPLWNFTDTWILIGLGGYFATFLTGLLFIGPTAGKLGRMVQEQGPEAPGLDALMARIFAISRVDQVVLLLVIADMVFRPGT
jgi:uncharacterized membrane protein